ncbi:hypothetical protein [Paraglaciecola sp. L1A13]|uniref:hypothetical protein n=1 Tax=Paraglaciecola sp. L1A13 TaxID=2686359 RepID=UPI00131B5B00|nr:hypothetical protein [Paraglaciecola sp. L1A13]
MKKIFHHSLVSWEKIDSERYLIFCRGESWMIWPRSKKYKKCCNGRPISDFYIGEIEDFYQRFITKRIFLPENSGKVWNPNEEDILFEMIQHSLTITDVARELERSCGEVAMKLVTLNGISTAIPVDIKMQYDVSMLNIIKNLN